MTRHDCLQDGDEVTWAWSRDSEIGVDGAITFQNMSTCIWACWRPAVRVHVSVCSAMTDSAMNDLWRLFAGTMDRPVCSAVDDHCAKRSI